MKKRLAMMLIVSMIFGTMQVTNTPAVFDPDNCKEVGTGPYNMREMEKIEFHSSVKREGNIEENYNNINKTYTLSDGAYIANAPDRYYKDFPRGTMYVTLDGIQNVPIVWSESAYKDPQGKEEYMGVVKPQDGMTWSSKSAIVIKPHDSIGSYAAFVTASEDGPRDFYVEYSVDGGVTYKKITDKIISLKQSNQVQNILGSGTGIPYENIDEIMEAIDKHHAYIKLTVASDYKLNGEKGLYGSSAGEWIVHDFSVYTSIWETGEEPRFEISAKKLGKTKAKVSWEKVVGAKKYIVYQRKLHGKYKKVKTVKATKAETYSCIIKKLNPNAIYDFKVKAIRKNDEHESYGINVNMPRPLKLKDIKLAKKITLKKGQKKKVPLTYKNGTDKTDVKSIQYKVAKKKIAKVKNGKIIAKKKGTTKLKVKVTLRSGLKKTLSTKIVVK